MIPVLILTATVHYNLSAVAKSAARIGIRQVTKAYSRTKRFFCTYIQHPAFMAGLLGASSDAPVPFVAGYANPDSLATNPEIGISPGGSKNKGTPMSDRVKQTRLYDLHTLTATELAALAGAMHPAFFAALLKAWRVAI